MKIVCQFMTYLFLERTEMVEIQLETYTVDSISAHRKIRQDTLCFLSPILTVSCNSFPLPFLKGIAGAVFAVFCYTLLQFIIWMHFLVFFNLYELIQTHGRSSITLLLCSTFREKLDSELKACQAEKQSIELKLASFEILGKEFEALAEAYCRIRQEIETKNWVLKEFTQ